MPTTYSTNLKIALPATGELAGTWGTVTNTNLGTLFEQAIVGAATVAMADANQTISITDGASSDGRAVYIKCTGALTAGRNLVVPTVNKNYIVENATTGGFDITVKTTAGTGIAVKPSTKRAVYADATNVVEGLSGFGNTTVTGTLSVSGALTYGGVALNSAVTGTGNMVLSTSPTLVTPALGTPASGTLTNCTGLPGTGVASTATSWTPIDSSGAGLTFSGVSATYQRIGNWVFASFRLTFPATASSANVSIGGLPVTTANSVLSAGPHVMGVVGGAGGTIRLNNNATTFIIFNPSGAQLSNADVTTLTLFGTIFYPVTV